MSGWGKGELPGNAKIMGVVAVGGGAVGAASVAFMGDPTASKEQLADDPRPTVAQETSVREELSVKLDGELCAPRILKTEKGCAALSELRSGGQGLLADGALPKQPVTLAHPDDFEMEPRVVDSCETYAELKRQDWSGISNADMRREARFYRACGLLILARAAKAKPAAATLARSDLANLDQATLPGFGEARAAGVPQLSREEESPARWSLSSEGLKLDLNYLGTADFDADDDAEHLMEYRVSAKGGSFRDTGFGLIETNAAGASSFRVINPFTM